MPPLCYEMLYDKRAAVPGVTGASGREHMKERKKERFGVLCLAPLVRGPCFGSLGLGSPENNHRRPPERILCPPGAQPQKWFQETSRSTFSTILGPSPENSPRKSPENSLGPFRSLRTRKRDQTLRILIFVCYSQPTNPPARNRPGGQTTI